MISASSNVLFNGFSGVHNVQFLEEEAELLFKMLPYRLFFLFRKLPQPLSKWTKGFFFRQSKRGVGAAAAQRASREASKAGRL